MGDEVTRIIAESNQRLDRIFDDVGRRTELIRNLKKKLQHSSSVLHRRENKLEEKINRERFMQNELQKVMSERDNLKVAVEQKSGSLAKEQNLVKLKDKEITDLLAKMSELESNLNTMYHRMSDRDKQLNDARNQLLTYSPCPDCGWMRDYIHRLEYQLQHYRYPEVATPYRYSNDILNSTSNHGNNNGWVDPRYQRHRKSSFPLRNSANSQPCPQQPSGYSKSKRSESYWRQQAASRQRIQEFRNASLALSPIKEDTEEVNVAENNCGLKANASVSSSIPLISASDGEKTTQVTENICENGTNTKLHSSSSPGRNTSSISPDSCHYFTVRTEKIPSLTKKENSMTYLHIASGDNNQQIVGPNSYNSFSSPQKISVAGSKSSNLTQKEKIVTEFAKGDTLYNKPPTSTPTRPSDTSLLHRLAVENSRSSPDLSLQNKNKPFASIRSFSFLNSSVTSSGSVASTESAASDTTGCSSDSGVAHQAEATKRVKSRRTKRSRKSSKYITFRDHKIDVTRFSTPEFRQIMWSLCVDPSSADEFLNFLAAHAKRLQSDPQWSEKHSLGTPEEWLALKGSY